MTSRSISRILNSLMLYVERAIGQFSFFLPLPSVESADLGDLDILDVGQQDTEAREEHHFSDEWVTLPVKSTWQL